MEFIHHDPVCGRHWGSLYREFAEYQPVLCDARGGVVAAGFTIPLAWSGRRQDLPSGVDGALERGVRGLQRGRPPTTPMRHYLRWARADGAPFDPWLRVHWRLGAKVLRVAPRSMVVTGTVAEWEAWTRMTFPESGRYIVRGALAPVTIDRRRNRGRYVEPNVWMLHPVRASRET